MKLKNFFKWLVFFIPALVCEALGYLLNPIAAIFVRKESRKDWVNKYNREITFEREYLIKPFYWFQTHDNAVDEYFYGNYHRTSYLPMLRAVSQEEYDNSWLIRYLCRVMWMYRNNAYGFMYNLFSAPNELTITTQSEGKQKYTPNWYRLRDRKNSFQIQWTPTIWPGRYTSINIGWKGHEDVDRLMYANRIFGGARKYRSE